MNRDAAAAVLAGTDLFGTLGEAARAAVADRMTAGRFPRGAFVFLQGDPGDRVFAIVDGLVKVTVTSEQGDEMLLVTLGPPATFGELALVDGQPRSANVEVMEEATLLSLTRGEFFDLARQHPALFENLLRTLSGVLRRLTDQAADFVFLDLLGRVAKLLVRLAADHGDPAGDAVVELPLTQSDIARMVGASRQSVNQALRTLEKVGCIEIRGRELMVKDPAYLRRRAGL